MVSTALAFLAGLLGATGLTMLAAGLRLRARVTGSPAGRTLRALARARSGLGLGRSARGPGDLSDRIAAAGRPGGLGSAELMTAKGAAAVAAGAAGIVMSALAPGRLGLLVVTVSPAAGFLAPDLWLARRAAQRARAIRRELPAMLDLLRVSVEAGGSLPASLAAVGRRASGTLAHEWRGVARETTLGVPLGRALEAMLTRAPLPETRAFAAALERAARHGTPLAEVLASQARDARFALGRRVREDAARAGPKIQLVVALLLVPSVLLLVAAALAAALLGSGDAGALIGG